MEHTEKKKNNGTFGRKIVTGIAAVLCIVFCFLLICNLTIIVKGAIHPDRPPSVFGITPMVVLSGSMSGEAEGHIEIDDLIFVGKAKPSSLKEGDVIAFMDGKSVVTHRIISVKTVDGQLQFMTQGDANNFPDRKPVTEEQLVGIYRWRIPKIGRIVLFLQTPMGMFLCVGVPLAAFILFDILRRRKNKGKVKDRTAELEAELARLRKKAGEETE